ncbi:MAG TPA: hypothetical protein VFW58_08560 [Trichococcus sp.]|nr:hypothetical protein [Trichococcus sp.]
MPKKMEEALKKEAAKKGLTGKAKDKYVYGAMRTAGWKPQPKSSKKVSGK